jgi:hypothetical protein
VPSLGVVAFASEDSGFARPMFGKVMRAAVPTQIPSGQDTLSVQVIVGFDVLY